MAEVGSIVVRINADISNFTAGMQQVNDQLLIFQKRSQGISANFTTVGNASKIAGGSLKAGFKSALSPLKQLQLSLNQTYRTLFNIKTIALVTFGGLVKATGDAYGKQQSLQTQLKYTAGDTGELYESIDKWSRKMPVNTQEAIQIFTQMRARGLKPSIDDMEQMIDLTSALGSGTEGMKAISKALGDVSAKGKLMGQEVQQFANAGVNIKQLLVDSGLATKEMVQDVGRANISAKSVFQALFAYASKFRGLAAEMNNKWSGLMARAVDMINRVNIAIGKAGTAPALKKWVEYFEKLGNTRGFSENMAKLGKLFGALFDGMMTSVVGIGKALLPIMNMLYDALPALQDVLKAISSILSGVVKLGTSILTFSPSITKIVAGFLLLKSIIPNIALGGMFSQVTMATVGWNAALLATAATLYMIKKDGLDWSDSFHRFTLQAEYIFVSIAKSITQIFVDVGDSIKTNLIKAFNESIPSIQTVLGTLDFMIPGGSNLSKLAGGVKLPESASANPEVTMYDNRLADLVDQIYGYDRTAAQRQATARNTRKKELESEIQSNLKLWGEYSKDLQKSMVDSMPNSTKSASDVFKEFFSKDNAYSSFMKEATEQVIMLDATAGGYEKLIPLKRAYLDLDLQLAKAGISKNDPNVLARVKEMEALHSIVMNKQEFIENRKEYDSFIKDMQNGWKTWGALVKDTVIDASDVLADFIVDGKADFKEFVNSMLKDLMRLVLRIQIIAPMLEAIKTSMGSTFDKFGLSSMFGGSSSTPASGIGGVSSGVAIGSTASGIKNLFADGGWINEPVIGYGVNSGESYAIGEKGPEYVVPHGSAMGSPTNVKVELINRSGTPIKATTASTTVNGQETLVKLMLDAYNRNVGGYRDVMRGA